MRPRISPLPLTATLLALVGLALGCGQDAPAPDAGDSPAGDATPAASESMPADTSGGVPAIAKDEIDVVDGAVPESFPSDVPIYPESSPGSAMVVPGVGMFITFHTDAEVGDVLEHYRASFGENGWSVSDLPDMGLDAGKEDRSVQLRARRNEAGQTEIALNINEG